MQRRTGPATPPKKPPPPTRPGAFRPASDPFHVQQKPLPTPKSPLTPATAPFKRGSKPFAQRKAVESVKTELGKREASRMANVVGAQHGSLAGAPFGGASGPGAATDKFVPALTARSDLAAANHARLTQGGILTPKQRKREAAAVKVVEVSPTFHDTHGLPASVAAIGGNLKGRRPAEAAVPVTPPGPMGARGAQPLNPFAPRPGQHVDILGGISRAAGGALEAAASVPETLRTPFAIRGAGGGVVGSSAHPAVMDVKPTPLGAAITDTSGRLNAATTRAADAISTGSLPMPKGSIKASDLNLSDPQAHGAVTPGTSQVPIASIGGAYLTPEAKAVQDAKAIKRGWFPQELEGLNGLETLKRANSDPPAIWTRILRNAAADAVRTGGVPAALVGLGTEAATGHVGRAAGQLAQIAGDSTIGLLTHPVEGAVSHPLNFVPAVGLAGRALGSVGYLNRAEMGSRLLDTGLTHDVHSLGPEGENVVEQTPTLVNRGKYSRNLFTNVQQRVSDATATSRLGRATLLKHDVDRAVRNAVNQTGADHAVAVHAYAKAHRALGRRGAKRRAEILLQIADHGGRVETVLRHYEDRAAIDGPQSAAAGQAAYIRQHLLGHELTAEDQAFLDAHEHLSGLTSDSGVNRGEFDTDAQEYRRHEALIRSAAARTGGDRESVRAKKIIMLRKKLGIEGNAKGPAGESPVRTGKIAEAERVAESVAKDHDAALEKAAEPKPERPPKGSGRDKELAWRKERDAWEKRTKAARNQAKALAKTRTQAEDRIGTLKAAEMDQSVKPEVHAALKGEYSRELKAFADEHLQEPGAIRPHYVERVKVSDAGARPDWRTGPARLRFSNRISKRPASTGETFNKGDYLIDSLSPVRNNMRAQRMDATRAAYQTVVHDYGTAHGAHEIVPEGEVSVNKNTLTTLGHALRALQENPVSHQDYYAEEANVRGKLEDLIKGGSTAERGTTQDAGYFLPKPVYDRLIDYVRPESRNAYDKFLRQYQRALISVYPSTVLGNTVGSLPLAAAAGAIPFKNHAYTDAFRAMKNPELGPLAMRGKGAAAGLASDPHNPVGQWMDFMRRQSVKGEDYSRLAAFFSKASPYVRKRADELNMDVDAYLKKFVKGEIDSAKLSEFLDHAEKFLGDTVKPNSAFGRKAGHVILFHNWVGHMMKVMLWTLPVNHPGRATLINILGEYGDQYRQEHGVWPQWMTDFVPLLHYTNMLPGSYGPQNFTLAGDATQFTPQGTAGGVLDQLSQDRPILENAANVIAPPWSALLKAGLIDYKAANASPTDLNVPNPTQAFISQLLGMIPGERKFFPTTGQREDSLPWSYQPKMYLSPHGGRILSPFLTPGARPLGSRPGDSTIERLLGVGSRVAGVPLWTTGTEGAITRDERIKAQIANRTSGRSGVSADRRKRRLRRQYEHELHAGGG